MKESLAQSLRLPPRCRFTAILTPDRHRHRRISVSIGLFHRGDGGSRHRIEDFSQQAAKNAMLSRVQGKYKAIGDGKKKSELLSDDLYGT